MGNSIYGIIDDLEEKEFNKQSIIIFRKCAYSKLRNVFYSYNCSLGKQIPNDCWNCPYFREKDFYKNKQINAKEGMYGNYRFYKKD